eukprot:4011646-Pleurochrysis_carterae.AAC.1
MQRERDAAAFMDARGKKRKGRAEEDEGDGEERSSIEGWQGRYATKSKAGASAGKAFTKVVAEKEAAEKLFLFQECSKGVFLVRKELRIVPGTAG